MRVGLIGNYGATNVGDDAILSSILASHSSLDFTVFSANPEKTKQDFGVNAAPLFPLGFRSFFKTGFRRSFRALKSVDAVVLGGGGLFQDDRLMACFLWAWQLFWVYFLEKPLFIYATGVGPLKTKWGKKLARWAYDHAQVITVRDEASKKLLCDLGLDGEAIYVTADPVWLCRVPKPNLERTKHLYLVSLRPWLFYNDRLIEVFTDLLLKLKQEKNARFRFVVMQEIREHDYAILKALQKRVGGELWVPASYTELFSMLQTCEFAIGMRFHFLMAALMTQTPVLPIAYSPKVDAIFEGTALEKYKIPVNQLELSALESVLKRLSVDYNNVRVYEKKQADHFCEEAQKTVYFFNQFIRDLEEGVDAMPNNG